VAIVIIVIIIIIIIITGHLYLVHCEPLLFITALHGLFTSHENLETSGNIHIYINEYDVLSNLLPRLRGSHTFNKPRDASIGFTPNSLETDRNQIQIGTPKIMQCFLIPRTIINILNQIFISKPIYGGGRKNNGNTKKLRNRNCVRYIEITSAGNTECSFFCLWTFCSARVSSLVIVLSSSPCARIGK
jgi:hypothetical protein